MDSKGYAKTWLEYAKTDYSAAIFLQNHRPVPIEIICYHCQQAGEKALKAILVHHDKEVPRTHNLYTILELCAKLHPEIKAALEESAKRLSVYSTVTRYPDNVIPLEDVHMNTAVKDAKRILNHIETLLENRE